MTKDTSIACYRAQALGDVRRFVEHPKFLQLFTGMVDLLHSGHPGGSAAFNMPVHTKALLVGKEP